MYISFQEPDDELQGVEDVETALIKLGGSVITDKARPLTMSPGNIAYLCLEVARFLKGGRDRRAVIVHGGGSFGHVKARKHSLSSGFQRKSQLRGFAEVRRDMRFLNARIVDSLLTAGVNAVSLPAESLVEMTDRKVSQEHLHLVDMSLARNLVPVTFGDAVFDGGIVFTIISGDLLMKTLSSHLKPSVSVFCTDVDGVYDSNPRMNSRAALLEVLHPSSKVDFGRSTRDDVTGEMKGKISVLFEIAENSDHTYVVNGRKKGRLSAALRKELKVGTEVLP